MFALALLLATPLAVAAGPLQKRIGGFATYYNVETGNACVASIGGPPLSSLTIDHQFSSIVAPVAQCSATATSYVVSVGYEPFINFKNL